VGSQHLETARIAVVIPCYRVTRHILGVLAEIDAAVWRIYVIDDNCPDQSGNYVEANCSDTRVVVLRHALNQGVGGAVLTGYRQAIADGVDIIVKIDGDGQMDPHLIPAFIAPILAGEADYTKGNRFFDLEDVYAMPKIRLFGNAVLSFMTKLSSGYWDLFDPTNGYTAIHADVAGHLPHSKISHRYFFETDMLFRLNTLRAVVVDVPMDAKYGDEISNLKISKVLGEFLLKHFKNFHKRIFYNYYLRDLSLASFELPIGLGLLIFGLAYGSYHWLHSAQRAIATPTGIIMISAMTTLVGLQLVLGFFSHDIATVPRRALHPVLQARRRSLR
jgi:glycosyltransferase involved in cell wall biosynthesis